MHLHSFPYASHWALFVYPSFWVAAWTLRVQWCDQNAYAVGDECHLRTQCPAVHDVQMTMLPCCAWEARYATCCMWQVDVVMCNIAHVVKAYINVLDAPDNEDASNCDCDPFCI